ncbi:hypothetical protein KIN20_010224 [Parelaphostrongylus tenuis]|uniref:Uncharacterized protein n=1 Tax=Parelaphostrongylus tenuis TaxID=148309 RepID=A0AAD5MQ92_PARTN|nr:hypothetical protein KIN20_010224 [Parelaphostrongylus tenuis]
MVFLVNKAGIPTDHFMISLLATISTVFGCGVMPAGQGSTRNFTVTGFTLPVAMAYSTATAVQAQVPGIATSEARAKGFVERTVMQTLKGQLLHFKCFLTLCDTLENVESKLQSTNRCFSLSVLMRFSPFAQTGFKTLLNELFEIMNKSTFQVLDVLESQARSALLPDAVISAILSQLTVIANYTPLECPNVRIRLTDVEPRGVFYLLILRDKQKCDSYQKRTAIFLTFCNANDC